MNSGKSPQELSVAVVENVLMARVYENMSAIYDIAFGPVLQKGRRRAVEVMGDTAGRRILEVGVGTGLNLSLYKEGSVGSSRVDLQACKLEYSIVSPK